MIGIIAVAALVLVIINMIEIDKLKKTITGRGSEPKSLTKVIVPLKGKTCEITVSEPMLMIDIPHSVKGEILDCDDEWVLIVTAKGKKQVKKMLRLSKIASINEIVG